MKAKTYSEIKLQYKKLLEAGRILSLLFHVMLFQGAKRYVADERIRTMDGPVLTSLDVPATMQPQKIPEIPRPVVPIASPDPEMVGPEEWLQPGWDDPVEIPDPPEFKTEENPFIFYPYEKAPEPVGGYSAIAANLKYPRLAVAAGIEGTVIIRARIDEHGNVGKMIPQHSIGFEPCNEAAMAAIRAVAWKPALQRDEPIPVWISIPVKFRLK